MFQQRVTSAIAVAGVAMILLVPMGCSTEPAFDIVEHHPTNSEENAQPQNSSQEGRLEIMPNEESGQTSDPTQSQSSEEQNTPNSSSEAEAETEVPTPPTNPGEEQTPEEQTPERMSDKFVQNDASKLDILWVVDNSASMAQIQSLIRQNFRTFAQMMHEKSVDLQLGVTTTDICTGKSEEILAAACPTEQGRPGLQGDLVELNGLSVIHSSSPTMINDFARLTSVGISGSSFEHGLSAARMAVEKQLSAYGQNFLRPEAYLAIIIVSDEEDDGVGLSRADERGINYREQGLTQYFYNAEKLNQDLHKLLPGGRFSVNAIAGTRDSAGSLCRYRNNNQNFQVLESGEEYRLAAELTGGIFESICDSSWGSKFERLATGLNQQLRTFRLTNPAIESSIEVRVNGDISTSWTYHSPSNSIEFNAESIPAFGSEIVATYSAAID